MAARRQCRRLVLRRQGPSSGLPPYDPSRQRQARDHSSLGSPLEEDGIELSVPPRRERLWDNPDKHCCIGPLACRWLHQSCRRLRLAIPRRTFRRSGTDGSNPPPSSGESSELLYGNRTRCGMAAVAAYGGALKAAL